MADLGLHASSFLKRYERQVLFVLKGLNLSLVTVYQFLLIFVLTRTVGANVYPYVVFLASIGNYILSTDLGFSGFTHARIREQFVHGDFTESHAFVNSALNIYFVVPTLAVVGAAILIPATLDWPPAMLLGLVLYFASIVFSLPWQMVRSIMVAIDAFLLMEMLEFCRRVLFLLLAVAMLAGLSFTAFAAACLVAWVVAFSIAFVVIARQGPPLTLLGPRRLVAFAAENRSNLARTGTFGGLEFVFYNFPYLMIPALSLGGNALVFFDLFYKVSRFSGLAYNVSLDTVLPYQTRAWHEGRFAEVARLRRQAILLCLPIFLGAAAILLFFGQRFFDLLLHDFPPIGAGIIYAMIAMMFLIMLQCSAGRFLVGIGLYSKLVRLAGVSVGLAAGVVLLTYALGGSFQFFMTVYVGSYAVYALLYQVAFRRLLRHRR